MNERIEQLSRQVPGWNVGNTFIGPYEKSMEKFAELIVLECTDLVQKYMTRWPEDCELTKQIKEHFGVE